MNAAGKQISQAEVSQLARTKKDYIAAAERNGYLLSKGSQGILSM